MYLYWTRCNNVYYIYWKNTIKILAVIFDQNNNIFWLFQLILYFQNQNLQECSFLNSGYVYFTLFFFFFKFLLPIINFIKHEKFLPRKEIPIEYWCHRRQYRIYRVDLFKSHLSKGVWMLRSTTGLRTEEPFCQQNYTTKLHYFTNSKKIFAHHIPI